MKNYDRSYENVLAFLKLVHYLTAKCSLHGTLQSFLSCQTLVEKDYTESNGENLQYYVHLIHNTQFKTCHI